MEGMEGIEEKLSAEENISAADYYNEGVVNFEEEQYELSIENFKKAIELDEAVFDYHYNLGVAYLNLQQYDQAIEAFKKGLPLNVRDTDIYINLGTAFYNKGEYVNACKAYKKAAFMNSGDPENCNYAGVGCCAVRNFKESINYFRQAIKLEPRNEDYTYNLAQAYYECERYDIAEETLITISRYNKQNKDIYLLLGRIYLKQSDYTLAKDSFETALRIDPDNEEAQNELEKIEARKASKAKKSTGPAQLSELEIELGIKEHVETARMLIEKKDFESACRKLEKAVTLIKSRPQAAMLFRM